MIKINPIKNVIQPTVNKIKERALTERIILSPYKINALCLGSMGLTLSTFIKDYRKTVDNNNYFQLKINPETKTPYKPDVFQEASGMNLYLGNDVLVTAPTGTGKTAIAEYVITKNLKDGKRTFYTTPLKALSNEKFRDFCKIYGEENVGLLTGDTKINTTAPIIIMTTEVYRNMTASNLFNFDKNADEFSKDLKTVIFDELQYLGDIDRGGIWEQSIMFTPQNIQILSLSATIGNNVDINNWIASTKGRKGVSITPQKGYLAHKKETPETVLINVPSENRHVPLTFQLEHTAAEIKIPRGLSKKQKINAKKESARRSQSIYAKPRDEAYKMLTKKLNTEGKLPAIYFVFSKKECRHLLKYLSTESELLTTEKEQREIDRIINQYKESGIYLGESLNIEALKKGYAIHNAGLLPSQKQLVEELFQKKLVKVVLATETLSAGINMPAKTTVISSPRKPSSTSDGGDDHKRNLTPNEFHQMAGRAGRRGIDTEGFCFALTCNPEQTKFYNELIESSSNKLESNLDIDYSFITNYLAQFSNKEELRYLLSKSLYVYTPKGNSEKNLDRLIKSFEIKKNILLKESFIDKNSRLTTKGELIKKLNGYEQIPIINIIGNKTLEDLNPIQIAGIIGGLANLKQTAKEDFPQKSFSIREGFDEEFKIIAEKTSDEVSKYIEDISELYPDKDFELKSSTMEHLYKWAELNSINSNRRKNWRELYSGELRSSIKDEGSLFKEITATADLLKQLIEVSTTGEEYSESSADKMYYKKLKLNLQEALRLIEKDSSGNVI